MTMSVTCHDNQKFYELTHHPSIPKLVFAYMQWTLLVLRNPAEVSGPGFDLSNSTSRGKQNRIAIQSLTFGASKITTV